MLFPSLKVLLIFKEIMITLKRQSILASTKENLLCTLGSVGSAGMNLPVLINLFREDNQIDLIVVAKSLGFPSIQAMLDSNEFKDIITVDFRLNTLGTKQNDIPVLCYYIKPPLCFLHIIKQINDCTSDKNLQTYQMQHIFSGNPEINSKITEVKNILFKKLFLFREKNEFYNQFQIYLV